ncbi:hypothetical protein [Tichowtungia aerotolerans]|uniref:Uncharacterized protein n=1 Tax=Tichowtungia aerotolerans TaxID=2697043 RepID=A0A6P1M5U6_9BACT|nr:hypothetical protein [Tichowtungia aerotolerans]QHI70169.1 hypothetical protein GT409_12180 [Tichowtungia aerotolerans]
MKKYTWTITGFTLGFVLWFFISCLNIDVFETMAVFLSQYEHHELDELFIPIAIIYIFAMIDVSKQQRNLLVEKERLKIYRKMMKAVEHILNNFLQKMMLFKLTAEKTKGFDPKILFFYDHIIDETTEQIKALGSIQKPDERSIENVISLQTTLQSQQKS